MNLQEKIDQTEEYGTLVLDFNEYFGQIIINKPITIDGQNSTICAKSGPVLSISSEKVELRNLRAEVTSVSDSKDGMFSLALLIKENIRVRLENIVVKGNVSGLMIEDGVWEYPDVINLWPVVPNKKNYFVFDMNVPISCVLETDVSDLRIINPGIKIPGANKIQLEVENLKPDTLLFGQIEIKSSFLTRIISVSGGSFGIPDKVRKPDKNKPVYVGKDADTPEPDRSPAKLKPDWLRNLELAKLKKALIAAVLIICIGVGAFFSFSFFTSHKPAEADTRKPTVTMNGIKSSYTEGDTIDFTANAEDNQSLRKMTFKVENTPVEESWRVRGESAAEKYDFPTSGWKPGTYAYSLVVEDRAENSEAYTGNFVLKEKPDSVQPAGKISGIGESYTEGDIVDYDIQASDNKTLRKMTFKVKENSSATKAWNVDGRQSATYKSSFSTKGWNPGTYTCALLIEDRANNSEEYTENFILKKIEYGEVNIVTAIC